MVVIDPKVELLVSVVVFVLAPSARDIELVLYNRNELFNISVHHVAVVEAVNSVTLTSST